MHRTTPGLVLCLLVTVGLAGCSDGGTTTDPPAVSAETGAINGLLVDDRFRPIQLTDEPETEFQATGFVLLQETGQQTQTTANGEFSFTDLEPGTYTIRAAITDHEATPQRMTVKAGEFAEVSVVARRVISLSGSIVTQDYAVFIPCAAYATLECTGDLSGDSFRGSVDFNLSAIDGITYVAFEALMNQPGIYCLEVREREITGGSTVSAHYGEWCTTEDDDYLRGVLKVGEAAENDARTEDPFDPGTENEAPLFYFGSTSATCWNGGQGEAGSRCLGVGLGIEAKILMSLFVGEPEVDIESYCVLCS